METAVAGFLATVLEDDRIERRRLSGAKDRGDIAGLRFMGDRIVVEVKDYGGQVRITEWLREAEVERGNDDAAAGVVVFKIRGVPYTRPEDQGVAMTLGTFAYFLSLAQRR